MPVVRGWIGGESMAFRKRSGQLALEHLTDSGREGGRFQPKNPAQARRDGGSGRAMVHGRVRQRDGDAVETKRKVREVSRPFPDAEPLEDPNDFRDSYREEGVHRGDSIREGFQQASIEVGQSIFHERRSGSGVSEGVESGLWDEIKYRIRAYPVALGQILWSLIRVLY